MTIACWECGCTKWYRPVTETERGIDILDDVHEDGIGFVHFEGRRFNRDEGEWLCYDHDHAPNDETIELLDELELEWT